MSLSVALGPYPVIRHFYPIHPETSSQQQAAVYNEPGFPLVAPILSMSVQQPRESRGKNPSKAEASLKDTVGFRPLATRPSDWNILHRSLSSPLIMVRWPESAVYDHPKRTWTRYLFIWPLGDPVGWSTWRSLSQSPLIVLHTSLPAYIHSWAVQDVTIPLGSRLLRCNLLTSHNHPWRFRRSQRHPTSLMTRIPTASCRGVTSGSKGRESRAGSRSVSRMGGEGRLASRHAIRM